MNNIGSVNKTILYETNDFSNKITLILNDLQIFLFNVAKNAGLKKYFCHIAKETDALFDTSVSFRERLNFEFRSSRLFSRPWEYLLPSPPDIYQS